MPIMLGDIKLQVISGGRFRLDGGAMFGLVPKPLWERKVAPDARNRIPLDTNCLLARVGGRTVLIDSGFGTKLTDKQSEIYDVNERDALASHLAGAGVTPGNIDLVVLTHLHFDHAGGCTRRNDAGELTVTFPHARHVVQAREWQDAAGDAPELRGTYEKEHFVPLHDAGLLDTIEGDRELLPGLSVRLTNGHTGGHQAIILGHGDRRAIYLGDLCPTTAHLRTFWSMGYDQFPLAQRRSKLAVLGEAADKGWLVIFDHDPKVRAAYLRRDSREEFVVREFVTL
ncbi:MAG: MBL fold metallo-hydrolase [Phycisphaeraceae bacterium]